MKTSWIMGAAVLLLGMISAVAFAAGGLVGVSLSPQEINSFCPAERAAVDSALTAEAARFDSLAPGHHDEFARAMTQENDNKAQIVRDQLPKLAGVEFGPNDEADLTASLNDNYEKQVASDRADESAGKFRPLAMRQASHAYQMCLFRTFFARSMAASAEAASNAVNPVPTQQQAANAATPDNCVTLEPRQNSNGFWNAINHCGFKVSGNYCFEAGGVTGCQSAVPAAFGPVDAFGTSMIYGPDTKGHLPGETYDWHVSYCPYDQWLKGQCRPKPFH